MQTKTFYVADGVSALSAGVFSAKRTIRLTDAEAAYDLALGRLLRQKPRAQDKAENESSDD